LILSAVMAVVCVLGFVLHASNWLIWLNALGGLAAFGIAAGLAGTGEATSNVAPVVLGVGFIVLAIVGGMDHATEWLVWTTFAFGLAFVALGGLAGVARRGPIFHAMGREA
jgi:hypothetical protein